MSDNGKSKEKSIKSSLFGGKTSAKKESKKKMTKTQQKKLASKSSSAENVSENVNGVEGNTQSQNLELNAKETSKANSTSNQNESISQTEEICNNKEVGEVSGDNLEADTENSVTNKPIELGESNIARDANCELSENIIASAVSDEQQNCAKQDDTVIEKHVEVSGELTEDAKRDKQIESDVENKGYEIMATGDLSKKHGKASSGPLASFRRHKKKSKLSKLSQDAGDTSEKKEESVTESPEVGKDSAKAKAKEVDKDCDKDKTEIATLNSAGKMVEIKEASETQKCSSTANDMVNETSEEKRITKRPKEKRSGPFANFRKSKKKDSEKQQSESSKNEENKPEDAKETPENAKENVTDVPSEPNEENVVQLDKKTTEIKQSNTEGEKRSPENDGVDSRSTAEEQIVLNDEQRTEEKNTEKSKKGKRFGSFSNFGRTKKAPKMSEQTAPPSSTQIDSPENIVTHEQGQIKTDHTQSTTAKELQDESSSKNEVAEIVPTEISNEKPVGNETQGPEIPTETGNEEQQQEDVGPNQEKKKGGLKKRIAKIKLHSSKSKENKTKDNQVKDSAQNQTELELQENKTEAGTDDNEVSLQVKRKKSGGLQKKISKALKRNKSGQLELNEPYDDPSASEEEIQPLMENKSPISTSPTEPREGTTETDAKQDEPVKQAPVVVPEVVEVVFENEQSENDEKSPSSTSDTDVKRVTFSLDEEKHSEKPEDSHEQPENTSSELEQETCENIANHEDVETDASREQDSVTIEGKESVPIISEIKPEEDSQTSKAESNLQPNEVVVSDIQEVDGAVLSLVSLVTPSLESLNESTGTVVLLESTESELTRVSPIPGMFEPINEGTDESTQEKQEKPMEERVEKENVVNEEQFVEQQHDENTESEHPKENLQPSEPVTNKVNSQENVEESAVSSETVEDEKKALPDEETNVTCSEAEEVDRTVETDMEKSAEKNLENSLETSIQNFLSQNAKEEWILVKPRLEISQEMSHQVKALALESYAHRPACCKIM